VVALGFGAVSTLIVPLVVVQHGTQTLGMVLGCGGLGALAGAGATWQLGDRKLGLRAYAVAHVAAGLALAALAASAAAAVLCLIAFSVMAAISMSIAIETATLQRWSPPAHLGRILGLTGMIRGVATAIGILGTGALVDRVLEPGFQPGGGLAGPWWAAGPGQGYRLAFVGAGLGILTAALGWIILRPWRHADAAAPPERTAIIGD
jgi:diaminobutyrate-2-oxoglutarate transaminase